MRRAAGRLLPAVLALAVLAGISLHAGSAWARQSMSFVPGHRAHPHVRAFRGRMARSSRHGVHRVAAVGHGRRRHGTASNGDEGSAATAVPGAGFTLQDGVLTYPAPARFQPQNLKHHP